jgi:PAS domain S-box-containing protein
MDKNNENNSLTFEELKSENIELKKKLNQLQYKEHLLDLILNNIPQSIYFKDTNGTYTGASKSLAKKFGLADGHDLEGMKNDAFYSEEHCIKINEIEKEILEKGKSIIDDEVEEVWPDGTKTYAINSNLAIKDSSGNNIGIFGISNDITKQKESEIALENNLNFLEVLINTLPTPIFYKDIHGRYQGCNDAFVEIIGKSREDLIGKTSHDIFPERVANELHEKDRELLKANTIQNYQFRLDLEDDSQIDVIFHQASFLNHDGEIVGLVGGIVNITAQKQAEVKLEEYTVELKKINANKDRFFSIIAHDLKNPFITLLGFTEALLEDYHEMNYKEHLEYISQIRETSKNSYQLLENLLQWSRSQSGRLQIEPVDFNLKEIVDEVVSLKVGACQSKGIELNNLISPQVVHADKDMFKTVLRNLISNSIKFTDSGGHIRLTNSIENDMALIMVEDDGVGIATEDIKKIFNIDKFYSTSGTKDEEGTGLGLVLCQEFVQKNKGTIWVESKEGIGSKFMFTIPLVK